MCPDAAFLLGNTGNSNCGVAPSVIGGSDCLAPCACQAGADDKFVDAMTLVDFGNEACELCQTNFDIGFDHLIR